MTSKNPTRRRVPSRTTRDRNRLRPTLTMLEDRRLLSTYIVNNPTDTPVTGETDLRQAIVQATSDTTNDIITFSSTVFNTPQTITLGGSQLNLTKATGTLAIQGPGANLLSISGNNASRVFALYGGAATLSGLTVTGGSASEGGGLYAADGTVSLTNVKVMNNFAIGLAGTNGLPGQAGGDGGNAKGGGIYQASGALTLNNVAISSNEALGGAGGQAGASVHISNFTSSGAPASGSTIYPSAGVGGDGYGGGIYQAAGSLTITGGTLSDNIASTDVGGLENDGGTATLTNCTVSGNSAHLGGGGLENIGAAATMTLNNCAVSGNTGGYGGGLYNDGGTATITGCTVSGNSASGDGGLRNEGTATITDCTISGNYSDNEGGGMASYGTLTLTGCTVSGNSAQTFGGGVNIVGTATITDCTVSANSALEIGGLWNDGGTATITDCTVSGNSANGDGGGLYSNQYASTTLINTIVAGQTAGGDISGPYTGSNNFIGGNPLLAPLGNYGGPTQTMALLPDSPAIGAGTAVSGITTDQRGAPRPTSGPVDIGAFQNQGYTLAVGSGSGQSTTAGSAFTNPLVAVLTENYVGAPLPGVTITFTAPSERRLGHPERQLGGHSRERPGERHRNGQQHRR